MKKQFVLALFLFSTLFIQAQTKNYGGWYMYFGTINIKNSDFKVHFEVQDRYHNIANDLEQLLIRTGLQYNPVENITFTGGYGFIQSEQVGEFDFPKIENRLYQEVLLAQKINEIPIRHRFRYEQRFTENIDFRTRFRYMLAVDVPITKQNDLTKLYAAFYNELFINGEINEASSSLFDRNRIYIGTGYKLQKNLALQLGVMNQLLENDAKPRIMLSLHHNFDI
jgi:hypothetical protein